MDTEIGVDGEMRGHQYQLLRYIHSVRMKRTMEPVKALRTNEIILIAVLKMTIALIMRTIVIAIAIAILMMINTARGVITKELLISRMKEKMTVHSFVQGRRQDRR